ncbi:MAG: hypothetical protein EGR88_09185 [Ruminococcus sp. SR1/5]|nr:hypothetical protein [Ruminococcus sp.]
MKKGVRNDAFLNSLTWASRVLSIKKLLSFTVQKDSTPGKKFRAATEQMYCSDSIIRENIFNVKTNMCEILDITSFKRYIKS